MRLLKNIPIRLTIGSVFFFLFSVTVLAIVLYSYRSNSRSILRVSDDLIEVNTTLVIEKTVNYLKPASVVSNLSRKIYGKAIANLSPPERFQRFAVEVLHRYPQFVIFNFGDELGSIYGAERGEGDTIIVFQTTRPTPTTKKGTYVKTFLDGQGRVKKVEREPTDYDPRVRPWYRGAVRADGRYWTGAYVLITDRRQIAISVAYPLKDPEGRLLGVVAGDLGIREISTFLRELRIGRRGFAFIVDEKDRVVAHPEFQKAFVKQGKTVRLKRVRELGQPWLATALQRHARTGKKRLVVSRDGQRQIVSIRPFPARFGKRWKIVLSVPEDDFVGMIKRSNRVSLVLSLVVLVVALLLISLISSRISRPIRELTAEANRIRELQLEEELEVTSVIKEIDQISTAMFRMKSGMRAFKKYVPATLVKQLVLTGEEVRLGGQRRELTIFFSDIKGFTTISERTPPEQLMTHLSSYLDELTRIIMEGKGTVDKYIGDAIMAFWGAPLPVEDHAYLACCAALRCQRALEELNRQWQEQGLPPMPTRMGIHTGETVIGNVGSSDRMNYTVLGDSVNLASRLEGVNKVYGTRVIVSQDTVERTGGRVLARPLDEVIVKGRSSTTRIHELVEIDSEEVSDEVRDRLRRYGDAFEKYLDQRWEAAATLLEELAAQDEGDPVVARLLARCRELLRDPPNDDSWRSTRLSQK